MLTYEQLRERKTGIGGSDAAALVGLSPYSTPLDIYLDKTTEKVKKSTGGMKRGHALEPFVKLLFEHKTGLSVHSQLDTQRSAAYPFMLAHLDGWVPSERAVVEFKTAAYNPRTREEWGEKGTDEIPNPYLIQVAHYASVMDVETVYIGVLFGDERLFTSYQKLYALTSPPLSSDDLEELGCDFRVYVYKRHPELTRKLISKEQSFWFDHVLKKVPPSPQRENGDDILKAYPKATGKVVQASATALEDLERLRHLKTQLKELEQQEAAVKASLLNQFGEASVLVDHSQTPLATWKNKTISRFDKSAFAQEHPHLCEAFTKPITTRELRLI